MFLHHHTPADCLAYIFGHSIFAKGKKWGRKVGRETIESLNNLTISH